MSTKMSAHCSGAKLKPALMVNFNLQRSDLPWQVEQRDCKERQLNSA